MKFPIYGKNMFQTTNQMIIGYDRDGKSQSLIGKSTIFFGPFSIASCVKFQIGTSIDYEKSIQFYVLYISTYILHCYIHINVLSSTSIDPPAYDVGDRHNGHPSTDHLGWSMAHHDGDVTKNVNGCVLRREWM